MKLRHRFGKAVRSLGSFLSMALIHFGHFGQATPSEAYMLRE
jgi:hypothetical protein